MDMGHLSRCRRLRRWLALPETPRPSIRHRSEFSAWIVAAGLAAGVLFGTAACGTATDDASVSRTGTTNSQPAGLPAVVRDAESSVVTIFVGNGLGSGVVYRADGVIVTNEHVVRSAADRRVEVAFADGRRAPGRVQAADRISDIAVVKVDRSGLPTLTFRSELPQVGELAVAIGSPLGFENSATAGIVSGLNRTLPASGQPGRLGQPLVDLIQTDAAISPGNSGGALLDGQGRVLGINEAYVPPSEGAVSLGFAIPSPTVVDAADQLLRTGKVQHAFLGVQVTSLTPEVARQLDIQVDSGVLVLFVTDQGPADRAGVRLGDVIRTFNGEPVRSPTDFLAQLRSVDPGRQVTLGIRRNGDDLEVKATVADRPA